MQIEGIFHGIRDMFAKKSPPAPVGDSYLTLAAEHDATADKHEKKAKHHRDLAAKFRAADKGDFDFGDDDDVTDNEMAIAASLGVSRARYIAARRAS